MRPRATAGAALAALLLAAPLLTGCGGGDGPDCAATARAVAGQTAALKAAVGAAHDDPRDAATALRRIQQHLDDITGHTDEDPAVTKAVAALDLAVSNAKNDLDNGVRDPDITPVTRAAAQLSTACPSKE